MISCENPEDTFTTLAKCYKFDNIKNLSQAFDESLLPYVVNLSYNVDEKFYRLIEKDLIKI